MTLTKSSVRPTLMRFPYYPLGLEALNYGAMGLVIGHEFWHALDVQAFKENNYFSMELPSIAKVESFFNCTADQIQEVSAKLDRYTRINAFPDYSINEYISDISGTKTALHTLDRIQRGAEAPLPGLENFTHKQLFFLAFANVMCTNSKPYGLRLPENPHNRNRYRIINSVTNSPEFAEIWKCPADSPMNHKDKCTLW